MKKILAGFCRVDSGCALVIRALRRVSCRSIRGIFAKSAVELAKEWLAKDRALRHLEALLIVADTKSTFLVSGNGDVIEPDDGICAIGSGGPSRPGAARGSPVTSPESSTAKEIAQEAMRIASEICIFTNANFTFEEL